MFIVNPFVKYVCKYEGNYVCEYKSKCGGECICKYLTTEKLILSRKNGSLFKVPWIKAVLPYVKTQQRAEQTDYLALYEANHGLLVYN